MKLRKPSFIAVSLRKSKQMKETALFHKSVFVVNMRQRKATKSHRSILNEAKVQRRLIENNYNCC